VDVLPVVEDETPVEDIELGEDMLADGDAPLDIMS
jgi:hypothetical protein